MPKMFCKPIDENIGPRLKALRKQRNYSLSKMTELLAPHVSIKLDGKSGESRISAIENSGGNLTPELAKAYSKIFDVSLEYIFCMSNDMQPENKAIKDVLKLEDIAIDKIKQFSETQLQILNFLVKFNFMQDFISHLDSFIYVTNSYQVYRELGDVELSFDDRLENDIEPMRLLPRWRLEKSVLKLIDEIVDLMKANNGELKIPR